MLTKPVTKNGAAPPMTSEASEDAGLRTLALKQLQRIRSFKLHLAMFLIGMPALTGVWALTEYMNADGWPDRFSDSAGPVAGTHGFSGALDLGRLLHPGVPVLPGRHGVGDRPRVTRLKTRG